MFKSFIKIKIKGFFFRHLPFSWVEPVCYSKENVELLSFFSGHRENTEFSSCLSSFLSPTRCYLPARCCSPQGNFISYMIASSFSLHLVHTRDIALEWEKYWLVVGYVHVLEVKGGITGGCTTCTMWHHLQKTNEEKCDLACSRSCLPADPACILCFYVHRQHHPETVFCVILIICFSFIQNNPKQLQGNSMQGTDKELWVVSSGRTRSNPFQPWSIHYGITMITFWVACSCHAWIHPLLHSTTPSYIAAFICL